MSVRAARKATNLSLDPALLEEARRSASPSAARPGAGLAEALRKARAGAWLAETAEAPAEHNVWIERNGLPLSGWQVPKAEG